MHLEIVCGSVEDALNAYHNGATRIECCSALELGGCTPTLATVKAIKNAVPIPVIAMVRCRGGDFIYSHDEKAIMIEDATLLCKAGIDGIVFGCLTQQCQVDEDFTNVMTAIAHQHGVEAIFHKAIDMAVDYEEALHTLIQCGVDRILSEGGNNGGNVLLGITKLRKMQSMYGDAIQICVGGGVRFENAITILTQTQCTQLHSGAKRWVKSRHLDDYIVVDAHSVYQLAKEMKRFFGIHT